MGELKSKEELMAAIVAAFAHNKNADVLHVTPDGNCFVEKHFANFHAGRNENFKVSTVERKDYTEEIEAKGQEVEQKKAEREATAKADAEKAEAEKAEQAKAEAEKAEKAEQAAIEAAAELTQGLKEEATALGVKLEGGETDEELKGLIADAKKEDANKTNKYVGMAYEELKAECDKRIPAIVYKSNEKKTTLIEMLESADMAGSAKTD